MKFAKYHFYNDFEGGHTEFIVHSNGFWPGNFNYFSFIKRKQYYFDIHNLASNDDFVCCSCGNVFDGMKLAKDHFYDTLESELDELDRLA